MQAAEQKGYANGQVLYMALELSGRKWRVGFASTQRRRQVSVAAGDREQLLQEIRRAKSKLGLSQSARVLSCYEAGRDGFWIHRWLVSQGIENVVVDASSIEVPRRARRAKTDRIDVEKLLQLLQRWAAGERPVVLRVLRVPDEPAEDARRWHRERQRLQKEREAHRNRIRSLLSLHGVQLEAGAGFAERLCAVRLWDGRALGESLQAELLREWERLQLVQEQLGQLHREQQRRLPQEQQMQRLLRIRGIGVQGAWQLTREVFGWRRFANRRELAGCVGLTGTPYESGESSREQGISKAGNARVRSLMVELSWMWLRYQPHSQLSRWYQQRFGAGGKRARRIGIVALARKLLISLWRYVEDGAIPEGAQFKALSA